MRYLEKQGINSYLIDWQEPTDSEMEFSIEDYIKHYISKIIDFIYQKEGRQIILSGYCMGGVLSIAVAQLNPDKIKALALLATPWNFHSSDFARIEMDDNSLAMAQKLIDNSSKIHSSTIQSLFYYLHSDLVHARFDYLLEKLQSGQFDQSVALEYWLNDGISMVRKVASECFIGWVNNNKPFEKKWQVSGEVIDPSKINIPVFMAMAKNDHIVPISCTKPLADLFENKTIIQPDTGHVAMIAGAKSEEELWQPFLNWCNLINIT